MLCVDHPFNTRAAWRYLEDNGANITKILVEVMKVITDASQNAKDFRAKPRRAANTPAVRTPELPPE
jgi:hypothetical protein